VKNESKSKGFLAQAVYAHQESPETDESRFFDTFGPFAAKTLACTKKGVRDMAGRSLAIISLNLPHKELKPFD